MVDEIKTDTPLRAYAECVRKAMDLLEEANKYAEQADASHMKFARHTISTLRANRVHVLELARYRGEPE